MIPVLITGAMPRGLQIMEQGGAISTFPNLYAVIEHYKVRPCVCVCVVLRADFSRA